MLMTSSPAASLGRLIFAVAALVAKPAPAADVWPSFHNGGDTSISAAHLPLHWSPKKNVAWRIELPGYGQSAPVVWKQRIFITAIAGDEKETCIVAAFDANAGTPLWKHEFDAAVRKSNSATVSRAAPTPLVDEDGLYALF
jgi:hypothetical protein